MSNDHEHVETEVKIFVPDLDIIRQRLEDAGATLTAPRVHEYNVRYENAAESLMNQGIAVRLRRDTRVRVTYKGPPSAQVSQGGSVRSRFEAEVTVDDFDTMDLILQRLGFHPFAIYEKYRTTYELDDAEIVLDEMPYGLFVEVEGTAQSIERVLARLDLAGEPRIFNSYLGLFSVVRHALNLDVHDLTFANFEGISVPPAIFHSQAG